MHCINKIGFDLKKLFSLIEEAETIESVKPLDFAREKSLLGELEQVLDRPLRVAVIGEFSTGKSTFINAVISQDLLPANFIPTTRQVIFISNTDGPGRVLTSGSRYSDAAAESMSDEDLETGQTGGASQPASKMALQDLASTGATLRVEVPFLGPWADLEICDTPGVNDATSMSDSVVLDLMDSVDVVVLMMRSHQALSTTETEFIAKLVRKKDLDKFFFNINFSDLQDHAQAEAVHAHVIKTLGDLRNWPTRNLSERVFLCSAKRSLEEAVGSTDSSDSQSPNEHKKLLESVHAYAAHRKQSLLQDAAVGFVGSVFDSMDRKLISIIATADKEDKERQEAIIELSKTITDFRVAIYDEEIKLKRLISTKKKALFRDIDEVFAEIKEQLKNWVSGVDSDQLTRENARKQLRIAVEEGLTPLLTEFQSDLRGAFSDLEQRIMPMADRTSRRIENLRKQFDIGPLVAGTSLVAAGHLVVSAALPWVLGAGGALAVTAGLATLIPGVGGTIGVLLGAAFATSAKNAPRILSSMAQGTAGGYRWLRDYTRKWQAQSSREDYILQIEALVSLLHRDVKDRLDQSIDPEKIMDAALDARFPEELALKEDQLRTARLSREMLRNDRERIESLRSDLQEAAGHARVSQ